MRGTTHNGRTGKDGAYSAKHNDRNFDVDHAEHIDKNKMSDNWYWHYRPDEKMTFEEAEQRFYEEHFKDSLDAKNQRYIAQRHNERVKTMDQYRQSKLSCPEETILQVGKTGDTIDPKLLQEICMEQIKWEAETFPNVKILDAALHVDEQGAPHLHERKVWTAHGKDGLIVGQAKALEEMGIKRPNIEKPQDRYNNAKMTYSAMCREHFLEVCKSKGLDLETEPDKTSKRGLDLLEYKAEQERLKLKDLQTDIERMSDEKTELMDDLHRIVDDKFDLEMEINPLKQEHDEIKQANDEVMQAFELAHRSAKRFAIVTDPTSPEHEKWLQMATLHPAEYRKLTEQLKLESDSDHQKLVRVLDKYKPLYNKIKQAKALADELER